MCSELVFFGQGYFKRILCCKLLYPGDSCVATCRIQDQEDCVLQAMVSYPREECVTFSCVQKACVLQADVSGRVDCKLCYLR